MKQETPGVRPGVSWIADWRDLLREELEHLLDIHREGDLLRTGQGFDGDRQGVQVGLQASGTLNEGGVDGDADVFTAPGLFTDLEDFADADQLARALGATAAQVDVAVADELAGRGDGPGQAGAPDQVVQAGFQQGQKIATGIAGHPAGLFKDRAQGAFGEAVVEADLLLLLQAHTVLADLDHALALAGGVPRRIGPAGEGAGGETGELLAETADETELGAMIAGHMRIPSRRRIWRGVLLSRFFGATGDEIWGKRWGGTLWGKIRHYKWLIGKLP